MAMSPWDFALPDVGLSDMGMPMETGMGIPPVMPPQVNPALAPNVGPSAPTGTAIGQIPQLSIDDPIIQDMVRRGVRPPQLPSMREQPSGSAFGVTPGPRQAVPASPWDFGGGSATPGAPPMTPPTPTPAAAPPRGPGAPLDIVPPGAAEGATPGKGGIADRLSAALKNVKAPPRPQAPYVGTPAAPKPSGSIKGNNVATLLQLLLGGAGGGVGPMRLG